MAIEKSYPDFVENTGYGTVTGLSGVNCRHSFYPFFEGISENAYTAQDREAMKTKTVTYNGQSMSVYDATQKQRYIERGIRKWKRIDAANKAAGIDNVSSIAKVREWQARARDLVKQTGLKRDYARESVQ